VWALADPGLGAFASDASCQLDVLWHDGHSLGVNRAQVGVLEQADQVGLAGFLQGHNGGALEAEIGLEVLCDFTNQALEWQLSDQQLGALLVAADFSQRNCSRPVTMWLLHATGSRGTLPGSLGGQLLARRFASGRLAGGLLCAGHLYTLLALDAE